MENAGSKKVLLNVIVNLKKFDRLQGHGFLRHFSKPWVAPMASNGLTPFGVLLLHLDSYPRPRSGPTLNN